MLVSELIDELALSIADPSKLQVTEDMWLIFINASVRDARSSGILLPIEAAESVEALSQTWEYDVPANFAFLQAIVAGDRTNSNAGTVDTNTDLDGAIADTTTVTITVDDNTLFAINDLLQIDIEIMRVDAILSNQELTVTRGYFSTTAATHLDNASILRPNADVAYTDVIPRGYWYTKLDTGGSAGGVAVGGSRPIVVFNATYWHVTGGTPLQFHGQQRPTIYTAITETVEDQLEPFLREATLHKGARFAAAGTSEFSAIRQQVGREALALSQEFLSRHPAEFRVRPHSTRIEGR